MSSAQPKTIQVILKTDDDWLNWLHQIYAIANEHGVRQYIDPFVAVPGIPIEPALPTPATIRPFTLIWRVNTPLPHPPMLAPQERSTLYSDLSADEREIYRMLNVRYDDERRTYRKQTEALAKVLTEIIRTVDVSYSTYTRGNSAHEVMVKLKNRFAKSDYHRKMDLQAEWNSLCRSTKVHNHDQWLQQWETTYDECLEIDMPTMRDDDWTINTFLDSIQKISPEFVATYRVQRAQNLFGVIPLDFHTVLATYRNWHREMHAGVIKGRSSRIENVYSTDIPAASPPLPNSNSGGPQPTLKNKTKDGKKRECLCGSSEHAWAKCPHMFEWNRPSGFKMDDEITKTIEKKKEKNSRLAIVLEDIRSQHYNSKPKSQGSSSTPSASKSKSKSKSKEHADEGIPTDYFVFGTGVYTLADELYLPLRHSYILDTGATQHVCNDRSRFVNYTASPIDSLLVAGNNAARVEGYGKISRNTQYNGHLPFYLTQLTG